MHGRLGVSDWCLKVSTVLLSIMCSNLFGEIC